MLILRDDTDIRADGRRTRIRDLYERLIVTSDEAAAAALRERLRAELVRLRARKAPQREAKGRGRSVDADVTSVTTEGRR